MNGQFPAKGMLHLFPLAVQGALGHLCLGEILLHLRLLFFQVQQNSLLPLNLLLQLLPAGQLYLHLHQCVVKLRQFLPSLFPADSKLLLRALHGRTFYISRHLREQLALPLLQRCPRGPCSQAFGLGLLLGGLQLPLRLFQLRLGGGTAGQLSWGGMMKGTAHGAGAAILQGLRQHPRLLVQERPVLSAVVLLQLLCLLSGLLIRRLSPLERLLRLTAAIQHGCQFIQDLRFLLRPLLAAQKLLLLLQQALSRLPGLPAGLQRVLCLENLGSQILLPLGESLSPGLTLGQLSQAGLPGSYLNLQKFQGSLAVFCLFLLPQQALLLCLHPG